MIEISFDENLIEKSKKAERIYYDSKNKGYHDKFLDGKEIQANRIGKLGELSFKIFLDEYDFYYEYDESLTDLDEKDFVLMRKNGEKANIDVKTQLNDYYPQEWWNCEVNEKQRNKLMDYYVFIKLSENKKKAFIVGFIDYSTFWEIAKINHQGNVMHGGEKVKGTKFDVKISNLIDASELINRFKKR
ncbi:MAG TPA: hypothetical protein PLI06_01195 [Methanofastidiosum sp.]|nr:hypothetical protein [Methanofastidiosum sp.]